jgi:GAF domain-containing protein
MRRLSKGSSEPAKTRRRKTVTLKRGNAPKAVRRRASSTTSREAKVARLIRERDEALGQQTATSDILKVISRSTFDLQVVLNSLVESAARLCDSDHAWLFRRDGEVYRWATGYGLSGEGHEQIKQYQQALAHSPSRGSVVGRTALEGQPVQIVDVLADPEYALLDLQKIGNYRTALGIPLLREDLPIGVLVLTRSEPRPFTNKQIELLTTFAAQAVIAIENARLLNELRESLRQQTATADVLKVISRSTFDLQTVLDTLLESAARLCEARRGVMSRRHGDSYHGVAFYNASPEIIDFVKRHPIKPGRHTITARVALERRTIHVADLQADPEYNYVRRDVDPIRTELGVPMFRGNDLVGVIILYKLVVQPFTDKQIDLVTTFADQAVIAIENARLFEAEQQRTRELTESLEQQTATSKVLDVISRSAFDLRAVFEAVVENSVRLCGAERGFVYRFDGEPLRMAVGYNVSQKLREFAEQNPIHPGRQSAAARAALERRTIHIPDVFADPGYTYGAKDVGKFRTVLGVPILKGDDLLGVIVIHPQDGIRPFTDKQIALVETFADQAAIAIENVRLLDALRQRTDDLTESLERQTATSDVLRVISSSPSDIQPVLETIGERAEKLCNAEISVVSIVDGELIRLASIHGMTEAGVEAVRRVFPMRRTDGTVTARAILTRDVCHVADVLGDPEYHKIQRTARIGGFRGGLGVPMVRDEQVIGAIFVARRQPGLFSDAQVQLLKTFADQAVIAIENVRLFKEIKYSLEQQTATADVLKIISRSTFDLRTVLQTLVESAARFCDADKANIIREKDGGFYTAEAYGYSREFLDYIKNIPIKAERGSASGRALAEGRVVHIADAAADREYTLVEARRLGDYRTILCVPMLREGVPIGLLVLTRSEVQPFTDKQIELVTTFADQAAIAIENVRLFESEQDRTRELTKSLEDLRTAQDRLVQTQKLASLGQLTAGIAHEIKNPLNFVNNFSGVSVELIDELQQALGAPQLDNKARAEIGELATTLRGNLDKIVQHGERADSIVKNMLLHSREGSGEHRPVEINALVDESLNLAYHGARAEKQGFTITLERSFDPAAGEVDVFPQEITRALLNLISNGFYAATKRKAEPNGGDYEPKLAAATKNLGDRVEIRIRDNGTGIPPDVKEKMFNPFFTSRSKPSRWRAINSGSRTLWTPAGRLWCNALIRCL